ncbi:phage polarity suppression protein [Leclercia pneumoniae]|uniref:phage polarity suppression protein n=1 Tax=Leclercia pneumoniae TaxID=2815358 RepID=UPI003AF85067
MEQCAGAHRVAEPLHELAHLQHRALDRATHHLREALPSWLAAGNGINHEGCTVLNAVGIRPDKASRTDSQQQ